MTNAIETLELPADINDPTNALTGKFYSGKNVNTLAEAQVENDFPTSQWVTFRQALQLGRCVRKGEKATAEIIKVVPKKVDDKPAKDGKKKRVIVKTYKVFNIAQTDELTEEQKAAHAVKKAA